MEKLLSVRQTRSFEKTVKKLKPNQKHALDKAIHVLLENPFAGQRKKGNLSDVLVYKFSMMKQETLLAYSFNEDVLILELLKLGSHENFYRDLKLEL